MTDGSFFDDNELLDARRPLAVLPECGKCGLHRNCHSPKMPVAGRGRKKILVVGEAPGADEDREGRPFVGMAGRRLQQELRANGISLSGDCWAVNAANCRPQRNQLPPKAVDYCRPLVMRAIEELKPRVILLLGQHAIRSVISQLWKEEPGGPSQWRGFRIPCVKWNAWVCATYHPSHVMRNESERKDPVTVLEFADDVRRAVAKTRRPWPDGPPDYDARLRLFTSSDEAAEWLTAFAETARRIAFDFETTTLKPDGPDADIVCCSVSDGVVSAAFPWHGKAVDRMKEILADPAIKKEGANDKFEHRWCLKKLGVRVRGWEWDMILAQHAIDGRPKISNVKFQTLVRLGVEDYSYSIKPFLEGQGGNGPNRIRKVNLRDLLRYCALDSLFEVMIARRQMKELGCE